MTFQYHGGSWLLGFVSFGVMSGALHWLWLLVGVFCLFEILTIRKIWHWMRKP